MTITTPLLWLICHPVAWIDTCVQNLTTSGSAVPVIWLEPQIFKWVTWPDHARIRDGLSSVGCDLHTQPVHPIWSLCELRSPITNIHKATQNVAIEMVYPRSPKVIGNITIRRSVYDIIFQLNRNCYIKPAIRNLQIHNILAVLLTFALYYRFPPILYIYVCVFIVHVAYANF